MGRWERLYRLALRLYPESFLIDCEDEMVEWFRAAFAQAATTKSARSWARFILLLSVDLFKTVPKQHWLEFRSSEDRTVNRSGIRYTLETVLQDLRLALRSLRKKPSFFLTAVGTLALGVAATTTIFSVVDAVLLRPLPYPEADRLVRVGQVSEGNNRIFAMSYLDVADLKEGTRSFEALAATRGARFTLLGKEQPESLLGGYVSAEFFRAVGVDPSLGRVFTPEEEASGEHVVVVTHELWRRRWASDPALVGETVVMNGTTFTVIGIMPPGFRAPEALGQANMQLWAPLSLVNEESKNNRGDSFLSGVARLRDGVTLELAGADLERVGSQIREAYPDDSFDHFFGLAPLHGQTVGAISDRLIPLFGAVGMLLLIACANVANLLLVRAGDRAREFAVRAAIGAGRGRIIRQLVTESLLLGVLASALGIALSWIGVAAFVKYNPGNVPRLSEIAMDARVVGFAVLVSMLTSLAFGLFPALSTTRMDLAGRLKEGGVAAGSSRGQERVRSGLVIAETGLAFLLVVSAGLLINSFVRLNQIDPGFDPTDVLAMSVRYPDASSPAELSVFFDRVFEEVRLIPGVRSAGATAILPISGDRMYQSLWFTDVAQPNDERYPVKYQQVAGDYFETVDIPTIEGRTFGPSDRAGDPLVAVINQSMSRQVFGDRSPLGHSFNLGEDGLVEGSFEIVGVVKDVRQLSLDEPPEPELYFAYGQVPRSRMDVVAEASTNSQATLLAMRDAVWEVRPDLPVSRRVVLTDYISGSIAGSRFYTLLLGGFAAIALSLALVGIYGSLSYAVSLRAREMSIRLALGATGDRILKLVLQRGMALVITGIAIGLGTALLATRVLESFVYGITPTDPVTIGVGVVAVLVTALMASLIPALRAMRLDPNDALRCD